MPVEGDASVGQVQVVEGEGPDCVGSGGVLGGQGDGKPLCGAGGQRLDGADRGVVKVAVIKRRSGAFPQVTSLEVDLCNLSEMSVAPDPDTPLTTENAVVCG